MALCSWPSLQCTDNCSFHKKCGFVPWKKSMDAEMGGCRDAQWQIATMDGKNANAKSVHLDNQLFVCATSQRQRIKMASKIRLHIKTLWRSGKRVKCPHFFQRRSYVHAHRTVCTTQLSKSTSSLVSYFDVCDAAIDLTLNPIDHVVLVVFVIAILHRIFL